MTLQTIVITHHFAASSCASKTGKYLEGYVIDRFKGKLRGVSKTSGTANNSLLTLE